ncbi:ABC transporter permease [Cohnella caldifontis]|uniref:ABC transporter permease n=1 Tax=Cohnella caldifontis TaxID=3027471 RepID=UPI0023EDE290|nr:ABC transporter permease [Cohnella sp. YIM B05605]
MSKSATVPELAASQSGTRFGILRDYGSLFGMCLVLIVFAIVKSEFMAFHNILGVLTQSTILIVLSLAMLMVMSVRAVDLSVAQVADAASIIAAASLIHDLPVWAAYLLPVAFGLIVGVANGVLMSYLGVPAIIGTLGMMFVIRSLELIYTNGGQPQILFTLPRGVTEPFLYLGQGNLTAGIPFLLAFAVIISVAAFLSRERSVLGRRMDAINGNVRTSFLAGVQIKKVFASAFVISGAMAAIAGIVLTSRTGIAVPRGSESYLLEGFVAVYLGTLASKTNRMNVVGTLIGALFVSFLNNWLTLMGIGAEYKNILSGCFILIAIAIGALRKPKS